MKFSKKALCIAKERIFIDTQPWLPTTQQKPFLLCDVVLDYFYSFIFSLIIFFENIDANE
jgi:hypothetical protein